MQISKENVSKICAEFLIIETLSNDVKTLRYAHKSLRSSYVKFYVICEILCHACTSPRLKGHRSAGEMQNL